MYDEEIAIWEKKKNELELRLWELIEQEHEIMQDLVMINGILKEVGNE